MAGQGKNEKPIYNWGITNGRDIADRVFDTRAKALDYLGALKRTLTGRIDFENWKVERITVFRGWKK